MYLSGIMLVVMGLVSFLLTRRSIDFPVLHFMLTPFWTLPFFYWWSKKSVRILIAGLTLFLVWQIYFCFHSSFVGVLWLGLLCGAVLGCMLGIESIYRVKVSRHLLRVTEKSAELDAIKKKYESRQQSLDHLERQVASLLNLFEIAREVSESVDFSQLGESLAKTLSNELPFTQVSLWILWRESEAGQKKFRKIDIRDKAAQISDAVEEQEPILAQLQERRQTVRVDNTLYFPAFDKNNLYAVFVIQDAQEKDLAKIEVLSAFLALLVKKISLYEMIRELAIIDDLTQVFVRRHFMDRLKEEIKRSLRFKTPISLLMLDIDHFKRYNDDFGHLVGDATLKKVAEIIKVNVRRVDLVGRYGGEEFIVVMPETRQPEALDVAERIRSSVARHTFKLYHVKTKMTVSQGLATFDPLKTTLADSPDPVVVADRLIQVADKCLYQAKEDGRNRVMVYKDLV